MRVLRQELQPEGGVQHARANTHRRETARLPALQQVVLQEDAAETTPEDSHRREAVLVRRLSEGIRRQVQYDAAHEVALGSQTLHV